MLASARSLPDAGGSGLGEGSCSLCQPPVALPWSPVERAPRPSAIVPGQLLYVGLQWFFKETVSRVAGDVLGVPAGAASFSSHLPQGLVRFR